ncbi:MAG: hypothetical protein AMXMBFR82_48110 [Candidatus Hydrogenedentota bacterium]
MSRLNRVGGTALLLILASVLASPSPGQELADLIRQRNEALDMIAAGYPMRAAYDLLTQIRAYRSDDPELADEALGNLHLLQFDINVLMTDRMREAFYDHFLEPETNEIDALLVALHDVSLKHPGDDGTDIAGKLLRFSQGSNEFVAVIALSTLAHPDNYLPGPFRMHASNELALRYPRLDTTHNALLLPIYHWANRRLDLAGEWVGTYLNLPIKVSSIRQREATDAERRVLEFDPFLRKVEPMIDALRQSETRRRAVDGLTPLLQDEKEPWRSRYGYLRVLEREMVPPPGGAGAQGYWKLIRPALETLANRTTLTPDVYRARLMLCKVESSAGQFESAGHWAERILTEQRHIREHPERNSYQETVETYLHYASELVRHQKIDEGLAAYHRLANHYPNSAVAFTALRAAQEARAKGQQLAMANSGIESNQAPKSR